MAIIMTIFSCLVSAVGSNVEAGRSSLVVGFPLFLFPPLFSPFFHDTTTLPYTRYRTVSVFSILCWVLGSFFGRVRFWTAGNGDRAKC